MSDALTFTAYGDPVGQAEVAPGIVTKAGKRTPSYYPNRKTLYPWRDRITTAARLAATRAGWTPLGKHVPARLDLVFWVPRPPSVRPTSRPLPSVTPDVQHLVRAVEDALTKAGVWNDDAQVTDGSQAKRYADAQHPPGVQVTIRALTHAEIDAALHPTPETTAA